MYGQCSRVKCGTANKDKQGQDSLRPGVTHSRGDMAHNDSPFAVGLELEKGKEVGEGYKEERPSNQVGTKSTLPHKKK